MNSRTFLTVATFILTAANLRAVPLDINALGMAYTENFDTLADSGTDNLNSTLPVGWASAESGSNQDTSYRAGTGSATTGDTYSFGATGDSDRALGGLQSGSLVPLFGVELRNNTASIITALDIVYTGEQWRLGATGRVDRLDFQYSLNATSLTTGLWNEFDALDFTAPTTAGSIGAHDGNNSTNRVSRSGSITGLTVNSGATIWLRWIDLDAAGSDDGLGIDDFSVDASSSRISSVPDSLPFTFTACFLLGFLAFVHRVNGLKQPAPAKPSRNR